jgi:putative membrane protein
MVMNHGFFYRFLIRWGVCGLGIWIASGIFSSSVYFETGGSSTLWAVVISGLILAIVNTLVKPILVVLSLPAILLTLGLFMLIVNGLTVWLVATLYGPLDVASFWGAILAGLVIGLVNFLVTAILENREK